jgi:stage III sporulation protein SpoIIIAA
MARYDHLPIYRTSFDLAVHIEKIVRNFSRYHKYSLGTELRENSRRILERIIEANNSQNRETILLQLREDLEKFKVLVRLCHQSGGFSNTKSYLYVSEQIVNLAKQNEGWLRKMGDGSSRSRNRANRKTTQKTNPNVQTSLL